MSAIILFDGECNFCNHSVQFIINRDPTGYFNFASLQSSLGEKYLSRYGISSDIDSLILIEDNKAFIKSSAALRIGRNLQGAWKLVFLLTMIPQSFRDLIYDKIAKNRYKWFGKRKKTCRIPSPEIKKRFLE